MSTFRKLISIGCMIAAIANVASATVCEFKYHDYAHAAFLMGWGCYCLVVANLREGV